MSDEKPKAPTGTDIMAAIDGLRGQVHGLAKAFEAMPVPPTLDMIKAVVRAAVDESELRIVAAMKAGGQTTARTSTAAPANPGTPGECATDAEMDGQYGNKPVYKDPPRWKGGSFKGRPLSDCSAEFLDEMASYCDWKVANPLPGKEDAVKYAIADARLARGWAARVRARHPDTAEGRAPANDPSDSRGAAPQSGGGNGFDSPPPDAPPDFGHPPPPDDVPFVTCAGAW